MHELGHRLLREYGIQVESLSVPNKCAEIPTEKRAKIRRDYGKNHGPAN